MSLGLTTIKVVLKPLLLKMTKTFFVSLLSKELFFWAAEQYVSSTDTKLDDSALKLLKALDAGDVNASREAIKELGLELAKK